MTARYQYQWLTCLVAATSVLGVGCQKEKTDASRPNGDSNRVARVYVTNYPLKYFAGRIAADAADVQFPMTGDGDPAFWQPDADVIARFQAADVILTNGATYEKWMVGATLPESRLVDTSASFRDKYIQIEGAVTHSHGPEGEHSHAGTSFTTWIDFDQAAQQAAAIRDALASRFPERADVINKNGESLLADLRELDSQMRDIAKRIGDRPLVASHPVYDYWARRYGLNVKSVQWEPDIVPDEAAIAELQKLRADHPAQVMIWEGTPEPESVKKLETIGLTSIVFDPCGNLNDSGDWLAVMRANLKALNAWSDQLK